MNESNSILSISSRKSEILSEISNVLEQKDERKLASLEARLAHRFGVKALKEINRTDESFLFKNDFSEKLKNKSSSIVEEDVENQHDELTLVNKPPTLNENNFKLDAAFTDVDDQKFHQEENQSAKSDIEENKKDPMKIEGELKHMKEENKNHILVSPPPKPNIKYLRRWIPYRDEDHLAKAS